MSQENIDRIPMTQLLSMDDFAIEEPYLLTNSQVTMTQSNEDPTITTTQAIKRQLSSLSIGNVMSTSLPTNSQQSSLPTLNNVLPNLDQANQIFQNSPQINQLPPNLTMGVTSNNQAIPTINNNIPYNPLLQENIPMYQGNSNLLCNPSLVSQIPLVSQNSLYPFNIPSSFPPLFSQNPITSVSQFQTQSLPNAQSFFPQFQAQAPKSSNLSNSNYDDPLKNPPLPSSNLPEYISVNISLLQSLINQTQQMLITLSHIVESINKHQFPPNSPLNQSPNYNSDPDNPPKFCQNCSYAPVTPPKSISSSSKNLSHSKYHKQKAYPHPRIIKNSKDKLTQQSKNYNAMRASLKCNYCKRPGHDIRECLKRPYCSYCGKRGHLYNDCYTAKNKCIRCDQHGHVVKNCPDKIVQQQSKSIILCCPRCQGDHLGINCPQFMNTHIDATSETQLIHLLNVQKLESPIKPEQVQISSKITNNSLKSKIVKESRRELSNDSGMNSTPSNDETDSVPEKFDADELSLPKPIATNVNTVTNVSVVQKQKCKKNVNDEKASGDLKFSTTLQLQSVEHENGETALPTLDSSVETTNPTDNSNTQNKSSITQIPSGQNELSLLSTQDPASSDFIKFNEDPQVKTLSFHRPPVLLGKPRLKYPLIYFAKHSDGRKLYSIPDPIRHAIDGKPTPWNNNIPPTLEEALAFMKMKPEELIWYEPYTFV